MNKQYAIFKNGLHLAVPEIFNSKAEAQDFINLNPTLKKKQALGQILIWLLF